MSDETLKAEAEEDRKDEEDRQLEKIVNKKKSESESTKRKKKWDVD